MLFFFIEKRHQNPIIPLYLMKNPLGETVLVNLLNFIATTGVQYTYPQYCQMVGFSFSLIGIFSTIASVCGFFSTLLVTSVQTILVHRVILVASLAMYCLCTATSLVFMQYKYIFILCFFVLVCLNNCSTQTLYPMMMMSVPPAMSAYVSIIPPTSRTLAQSLSFCLYSSMLEIFMSLFSNTTSNLSFQTSIQICYMIIYILTLINMVISIYRVGNAPYESDKKCFIKSYIR